MKKKTFIILLSLILFICMMILFVSYKLNNNATFYSEIYHGRGHDIFIPKYSYLESECCFTAATFYSLKSKKKLESEINNYLKDFDYYEDESYHGYRKDNLYIQSYIVEDKKLFRKIVITY